MSNIDERTGKPKIILDLCGGTGSWSRYYNAAGYDVRNITLPNYDVLAYEPPENVYGILAAPPLHRVFGTQLQGRGKGEKAGGGPKDCYGLHQDYPTMRTKVVGYGKPGRLSTRVYGKADFHIPALGVWRPLDKTYRPMGELFAARKTLQKVGRCSKQTPAVYAPRSRKAKLCVSTQIGSRPHTAAFICFAAE